MKKENFGFEGLAGDLLEFSRDFVGLPRTKNLKSFFGKQSFETSWQFIETLA